MNYKDMLMFPGSRHFYEPCLSMLAITAGRTVCITDPNHFFV
jgi:hypothetical protein